jgi:hypothetical protein
MSVYGLRRPVEPAGEDRKWLPVGKNGAFDPEQTYPASERCEPNLLFGPIKMIV